ncbi:MAG: ThiF family adenylyltransferase, partial [Mesorhizobium sp.]
GVGELIIVDGDLLEDSNLNRVRGYRRCDVGESKAATLARYIRDLGLMVTVVAIEAYVNESPEAVDAISSADLVFGCTDDVAGREVLNQAVYYYCQGLIDCGLTGKIGLDQDRQPYLRDHRGRVSTVLPESGGCLRCQGVVTEEKLSYESALKARPKLAELDPETLREEYYLVGGGERAPGVGPFT